MTSASNSQDVQRIVLEDGWTFHAADQPNEAGVQAKVPGVVQADLIRHGLLPDPFYGTNENLVQWVGERAWQYELTFEVPDYADSRRYRFRFDGLDTYATVWLNGEQILEADNMFRTWLVDVDEWLQAGENQLSVRFDPPVEVLQDRLTGMPFHLTAGNDTGDPKLAPYARKAQYQFGWDWGLRLVTCGIWRPVVLESWERARLEDVQIVQNELSDSQAKLSVRVDLQQEQEGDYHLVVRTLDNGAILEESIVPTESSEVTVEVLIDNPKRWWPNGQGDPHLYQLRCELWQGGTLVDAMDRSVGLRTIELVQQPDAEGEGFYFKINGRPVFTKGASYIPQDVMVPRITREQKRGLLEEAQAANMNLIRVWGGGIYEDDDFYHWCDSLGLLVWQDFMFACAGYPGDEAFLANVEEEIRQNVRRLRNHPSLLVWCGNNEVYMAWKHWGWGKLVGRDYDEMFSQYDSLFLELIPRVLEEEDPDRPYTHTSPLGSWGKAEGYRSGTMHYWGVWHGPHDFSGYETRVGRYMNEYGFQSFPSMETIAEFADSSQWSLESPVMAHHQKSYIGNGLIGEFTEKYGDPTDDFAGFVHQSQVVQYEGMRRAILAHRLRRGYCMGTAFWQLNDCWPAPSWSAIDYYGRHKVFFQELGNLYAPLTATVVKERRNTQLAVICDHPEPVGAVLHWALEDEGEMSVPIASGSMLVRTDGPGTYLFDLPANFMPEENQKTSIRIEVEGELWSTAVWKGRYEPLPLPNGGLEDYPALIGE